MRRARATARGGTKVKRILLGIAALGLVAAIGATVWLYRSLDGLVAGAIEKYGSAALGTEVDVGFVEIRLREGQATIRKLTVANPEGFSKQDAMAFESLTVQIDPTSITGSPIVVPQIRLLGPSILFEVAQGGASNVDTLRRNAQSYAPPSPAEQKEEAPVTDSGEPVRLRVGVLQMADASVRADLRGVGGDERDVALSGFELTELGGATGATPPELAKQIAVDLTRRVVEAVARERIGSELEKQIEKRLPGAAGEAAKDLLRRLPGAK
jgi:hypothetical protein